MRTMSVSASMSAERSKTVMEEEQNRAIMEQEGMVWTETVDLDAILPGS